VLAVDPTCGRLIVVSLWSRCCFEPSSHPALGGVEGGEPLQVLNFYNRLGNNIHSCVVSPIPLKSALWQFFLHFSMFDSITTEK